MSVPEYKNSVFREARKLRDIIKGNNKTFGKWDYITLTVRELGALLAVERDQTYKSIIYKKYGNEN